MAWLFQGVLNAGLQILLSIFGGWLCARLRLVDPEVMSRNVNLFAMKAAYPAFIIHLLGVKTDLRDGQAWKALGVFVLWVFLIHLACYIVHKLSRKSSNVLQLGLNCLLLSTNNTGCIGWPVLIATVGQQSAVLSMLLGVLFFIQLLPVSISCFEYYNWQQTEGKQISTTAAHSMELNDLHTGDQLPVAQHCKDQQQQLALPATATGFPHEYRYCYWSNELYHPRKASPYVMLSGGDAQQDAPPAALAEVCVESGDEDEAADHHCYGGGSAHSSSSSSLGSSCQNSASSRSGAPRAAPGREWWRSGRAGQPQLGRLKRAKDSCDSLYTPFAAAAVAAKQAELDQQLLQRPNTLGLSSLTRRLSRGLTAVGAAGAAAAAAISAAGAAAAASPRSLTRAASLHTGLPLTPKAAGLKKAPSLKPAGSLLRRQADGKDPLCQMSMPLMAEHSGEALSCCPSHRPNSPPCSPQASTAGVGAEAAVGAAKGPFAEDTAAVRISDAGDRSVSDTCGRRSSNAGGSSSSSAVDGQTSDSSVSRSRAAAVTGAPAGEAADVARAVAGRMLNRHAGAGVPQLAAASAVELHFMCKTLAKDGSKQITQQQQQQQQQQGNSQEAAAAAGVIPPVQSFADLAARGVDGSVIANVSSNGSIGALHTLGRDDSSGRLDSNCGRISSRSNLLPCGGVSSSAVKGSSKLGDQAAAGVADATARVVASGSGAAGARKARVQKQKGQNMFRRFVQQHPLLCHIVWNQAQSFHLWLNVLAIVLSVTGVRVYLDPQSPQAIAALGFVDGVLSWFSAACIPTLLFANGVWMCGKNVFAGSWRTQVKVLCLLLLKLTVLPALMIGLTQLCNIRGEYGLSLVLLASCPLAPLAFLVCQQYGFGAELATSITIQGVLLMLPQMMAVIKINQLGGLYDVPMLGGV